MKKNTRYVSGRADIPEKMHCLPKWFTELHTDYDLSAWCFYGYLGTGCQIHGVSLMLQYKNEEYWAAFGLYIPGAHGKWSFAGTKNKTKLKVDDPTDSEKWAACGTVEIPGPGRIRIALLEGEFGQPDALYQLTADVCSAVDLFAAAGTDVTPDLFLDIQLRDKLGAVPVGYGPASFLPNWLTDNQLNIIDNFYGSSTSEYLQNSQPEMENQGSYYYSSPRLEPEDYTIVKWSEGEPHVQHGKCGCLWMDHVVQNFGELNHLSKEATVSWYWFAIPKLPGCHSLAVTSLWYEHAPDMLPFKSASLYTPCANHPEKVYTCLWDMDRIQITRDKEQKIYELTLEGNDECPSIALTLTAIEGNQTLGPAIEGLFKVTGTIDEQNVPDDCYAWGEISLPSTQTSTSLLSDIGKLIHEIKHPLFFSRK